MAYFRTGSLLMIFLVHVNIGCPHDSAERVVYVTNDLVFVTNHSLHRRAIFICRKIQIEMYITIRLCLHNSVLLHDSDCHSFLSLQILIILFIKKEERDVVPFD